MTLEIYNQILIEMIDKIISLQRVTSGLMAAGDTNPEHYRTVAQETAQLANNFRGAIAELEKERDGGNDWIYICPHVSCGKPVIGKNYILLGTDRYHTVCYQRMLADTRERDELWKRVIDVEKELKMMRRERLKALDAKQVEKCESGACII